MKDKNRREELLEIYSVLLNEFGHQNWWPSDSDFETIIGAILAQNVSWTNVKKAVDNLKSVGLLAPHELYSADIKTIAENIISSRFYNQKSGKIKDFMKFFIENYDGSVENIKKESLDSLCLKLLSLKGFGPETCDSILLYAGQKPIFVVDLTFDRKTNKNVTFRAIKYICY